MSGTTTTTTTVINTSDITAYRQEVFNFLGSLTLKYSPMADAYNTTLTNLGVAVDDTDPTTWKYYLNLQGEYHPSDTMMTVVSLDTRATINFTKANLAQHVRTATAYVPGTSYYNDLCSKYPEQTDLIKSIVYPVSDINLALEADDLTILTYGTGFLEETEEDFILQQIGQALDYMNQRWNLNFLHHEPYFYWAFWGMVWQILPQVIFSARIQAIKTTNVHSWHIWQYLTSNGIGDYSDVLSRRQSMFLYRNMEYILANRGKQSNLILLVNNLLEEIGIGLFGRDAMQQTNISADVCELVPTLVPIKIPTLFADQVAEISPETVSDMNLRLISVGDEVDGTAEYVEALERQMGDTVLNTYPTKILEIRPIAKGKKYADFFNVFVMDTLVYSSVQGIYNTSIELTAFANSASVELTLNEALALMYYAIHRRNRETPVSLPNQYTCNTALKQTIDTIPTTIPYQGATYYTQNLVDLDLYVGTTPYYPPDPIAIPNTFSNLLGDLFLQAITQVIQSRMSVNLAASKAMQYVTAATVEQSVLTLDLIPGTTTYAEWFAARSDISKGIIAVLEAQSDPYTSYDDLAQQILTQLIPITSVLQEYGNFEITDQSYTRLKELFIQLCSYNITFLDTNRDVGQFMYVVSTGGVITSEVFGGGVDTPGTTDVEKMGFTYGIEVVVEPSDIEFTGSSDFESEGTVKNTPEITATTSFGGNSLAETNQSITRGPMKTGSTVSVTQVVSAITIGDYTYSS